MPETNLNIRDARIEDLDAIHGLIGQLGYSRLNRSKCREALGRLLVRKDVWVLVAEDATDASVLGLASMSERPQIRLGGPLVTIDEFVVSEQARGRGVGQALLEEAKKRARNLGAMRLQLDTNRQRESYRRGFYVKNGFVEADSAVMRMELSAE
jgi:N-acetylglutamate synthase-like GNAT family acetyltransferase